MRLATIAACSATADGLYPDLHNWEASMGSALYVRIRTATLPGDICRT